MESVSTLDSSFSRPLLRAIDLPAREAVHLAKRPLWVTLGIGLFGATLVSAASVLAAMLDPTAAQYEVDTLRAVFEALAVVVPSGIILATYARLRISPRAFSAAFALGLLVAGIVVVSALPLMVLLAVVARAPPYFGPSILFPFLALSAVAMTTSRVIRALDGTRRAHWIARIIGFALMVAFGLRVAAPFGL